MIAKLTGLIDSIGPNYVVVDVNGVGYLVYAPARVLGQIGAAGDAISMVIETHVRETDISLYGFLAETDREWFRLLNTVQGVGAKAAMAILSVVSPDELAMAIAAQDKAVVSRADGVGPKLAQRIVTELKDKAGDIALATMQMPDTMTGKKSDSGQRAESANDTAGAAASSDAVSALINLGYGRAEAFGAVSAVARRSEEEMPVGDLIRESLKELTA